jgi:LysM repeat protein
MNTPNPLVPQGSLERQSQGKSTARIAIFTIISIHAVFFAGLLMQGCRRDESKTPLKSAEVNTNQNALPAIADPGYYTPTQEIASTSGTTAPGTSTPVPPAFGEAGNTTFPPATTSESPLIEGKTYSIVKGDTLAKIANSQGVSLKALLQANPTVDSSHLKIGQKIQIPAPTPQSPGGLGLKEPSKSEAVGGTGNVYTVKAGETLTKIAKQHGTTSKAIRAANNLKTDRLVVGQKLKLPAPQPGGASTDAAKTSSVPKLSAKSSSRTSSVPSSMGSTNLQ